MDALADLWRPGSQGVHPAIRPAELARLRTRESFSVLGRRDGRKQSVDQAGLEVPADGNPGQRVLSVRTGAALPRSANSHGT